MASFRLEVGDPQQGLAAVAVIGGSDDARGALLGVGFMVILHKLLWTTLPQGFMVVIGLCLIVFVVFLPEGISGALRNWRSRRASRTIATRSQPA
ncbi:hypothetical protein J4558_23760 [Leptolyngbya sp. 15MV]|nr:hypothetical protein J4558_23760 [Leptolyngbya sp. 15MV]